MDRVPVFQERLLTARRRRDLSQDDLAGIVGVYKSDISKYERGISVPSLARVIRLANALNTSIDYLTGRADR